MRRRTPFFECTSAALEQVTRLYDFVWPAAAALWNLRWQVAGFHSARNGNATVEELRARFVEGSGIGGANLHRACLEHTWQQQTGELARFALINLLAIHESWTKAIVAENNAPIECEKWLQFPTDSAQRKGIKFAIASLRGTESSAMKNEVQPTLLAQRDISEGILEQLMAVYRYFKECRNSMMHRGGKADLRAVSSWTELNRLAANSSLSFKVPQHIELKNDEAVEVTLYGVVGFGDLVQRIMLTVDAQAASSGAAEEILVRRWKEKHGVLSLSSDNTKRRNSIDRHLAKIGIAARSAGELEQVLKRARAVA